MKKSELVTLVAEKTGFSKKDTEKTIDTVFTAIADIMAAGDKLQISGFGTFETKERAARTGHNPRTGEEINIAAATMPVFKPGKRRTVANDACDAARITVNGKPAKASYQVRIGDVIEIAFGQRTMKVEVLNIAEHTLKADASALYKEL